MDAVQEAMMKMLAYRERPADEWPPLFWSILRSRIIDVQRRRTFRLGWLGGSPAGGEDSSLDWADDGPGPSPARDGRGGQNGRAHVCTPSLMRLSDAVVCLKKKNT